MMTPLPAAPAISLRPVTAGDAAHLFAVYASTRVEELAQVDWTTAQKEAFLRMQFDAQRIHYEGNYPGAVFQVIVADARPAGRLYVHRRERELRIMDIALLPEFRGRGIGRRLVQEILDEGRRTERRVSIHVESFNPAQRLYARLGFRPVARDGVYQLMEWQPVGADTRAGIPVESEAV
jgi:ribosomal protein S18 acetylase RimI-like enzyme